MGERGKSGIYLISCSDKRYVGQAASIGDRWLTHQSHLRRGRHANRYLQAAWNKYGEAAFNFEVLEYAEKDSAALSVAEQRWVDQLRPEFNLAPVAGSSLGLKHPPRSEEFRQRMAEMRRGFKHKPETIERLRAISVALDYHPSPEHIEKLRRINTGRKQTPEHIEKSRQKRVGRKQTAEEIAKRRVSLIGKKRTAEQRARISEGRRGKGVGTVHSEETKRKIGDARRGRPRPDVAMALAGRPRPPHVVAALRAATGARYAERVARIRQAISEDPCQSAACIAKRLGVDRGTVSKYKTESRSGGNQ